MKFIICTLLLSAIAGINCFPGAPDYKYTYGIGGRAGVNLDASGEIGARAKDGTYSLFGKKSLNPSIYGDGGVFINPPQPAAASNNPQYPNIPVPAYNPYTWFPAYGPNYGVPQYNPCAAQGFPCAPAQNGQLYGVPPPNTQQTGCTDSQTTQKPTGC